MTKTFYGLNRHKLEGIQLYNTNQHVNGCEEGAITASQLLSCLEALKEREKEGQTRLKEIRENCSGKIFTYSMGQQKEDVKYLLSLIDKKNKALEGLANKHHDGLGNEEWVKAEVRHMRDTAERALEN